MFLETWEMDTEKPKRWTKHTNKRIPLEAEFGFLRPADKLSCDVLIA
jgi:hypothetical protein